MSAHRIEKRFIGLALLVMAISSACAVQVVESGEDESRGTVLAIMVAAVVFAAQHPITAPGGLAAGYLGGILLGGVGFGWLFSRYGLLAAIVVHFAVNLMMIFLPLKTG